ncbi:MAG: peptidoglycan DD-metalloendopeptidase family protein [Gemmatimonadota bacterium]|nr:MAG: peptidoglycan DD-metalloendopeptidase family protein [Gemmatimonadota bacterium]
MRSYFAGKWLWLCSVTLLLGVSACSRESLREFFAGYTPHERYERALLAAGLDQTALGSDWLAAARTALENPVAVASPYLEESYLDPREAMATAYRVSAQRGQRIEATFESEPDTAYQVFIDLFFLSNRPGAAPRRVASADSLERELDYLARRDGDYLIRVQPELLRGGRYSITVVVGPSLQFPVSEGGATDIGSWYGDPRDAGRRRHEGLDIFARRGTPVLAAADGVVRSTRSNGLGGNVIWLRDRFGQTHYYAHLDRQAVSRGQRVLAGDTIGFVGNTGNARTTPPHLHFGLYSSGSFDPYPALRQLPTTPADFSGDPNLIGGLARVTLDGARVRALPTTRSNMLAELPLHTPMRVEGGSGAWYRVVTPDGTIGYVAARLTEPADSPIRSTVVTDGALLLTDPSSTALAFEAVAPGTEVPVLGAHEEFLFVEGPGGKVGWLSSY